MLVHIGSWDGPIKYIDYGMLGLGDKEHRGDGPEEMGVSFHSLARRFMDLTQSTHTEITPTQTRRGSSITTEGKFDSEDRNTDLRLRPRPNHPLRTLLQTLNSSTAFGTNNNRGDTPLNGAVTPQS